MNTQGADVFKSTRSLVESTFSPCFLFNSVIFQRYGTQTPTIGTVIKVWPVNDPAGLDERRKAMGMQPMDEYLQAVKKTYRSEVYWDKSLTVEEAQQKMVKKP